MTDPGSRRLRVLLRHVHGSWTGTFVRGRHDYLLPVSPGGAPWGLGKAGRDWPSVTEVPLVRLAGAEPDVVVLQRPEELEFAARLGVPAVYVEHDAPRPYAAADVSMINEPVRRGRVTGADLLGTLAEAAPVDVFGMGTEELGAPLRGLGDVPAPKLHDEIARRRVYLHTARWTSLGLSLVEAMHRRLGAGAGLPRAAARTRLRRARRQERPRTRPEAPRAGRLPDRLGPPPRRDGPLTREGNASR